MPVVYLPEQDRFQLSCTAARKLPVKVFFKKMAGAVRLELTTYEFLRIIYEFLRTKYE